MNFFFMLTLILIILIFIKLKIKIIPNKLFTITLVLILIINEIYHYKPNRKNKESFNPYVYDGAYDKYFKDDNYLHLSDTYLNNLGKMCQINKNVAIRDVQKKKIQFL